MCRLQVFCVTKGFLAKVDAFWAFEWYFRSWIRPFLSKNKNKKVHYIVEKVSPPLFFISFKIIFYNHNNNECVYTKYNLSIGQLCYFSVDSLLPTIRIKVCMNPAQLSTNTPFNDNVIHKTLSCIINGSAYIYCLR